MEKNIVKKDSHLAARMNFPTDLKNWKNLDSKTNHTVGNVLLCNLTNNFIRRQLNDGPAKDFKKVNKHSYSLFKAGHIQNAKVLKTDEP